MKANKARALRRRDRHDAKAELRRELDKIASK